MALFQVTLDGSYGEDSTSGRMLAYGGWFGEESAWKTFGSNWRSLLEKYNLHYFRSSELRLRPHWLEIRERFGAVAQGAGLNVVVSVPDADLLKAGNDARRKRVVFKDVMKQLFAAGPPDVDFVLICDREQDVMKEVSNWVDLLRRGDKFAGRPDVYDRIAGICYMNSRRTTQVQSADLVANLAREQAEAWRDDPSTQMDPLLDKLTQGRFSTSYVSGPLAED